VQGLDQSMFFEGEHSSEPHFACPSGVRTQQEMQIFSHQDPGSARNVSLAIKFPLELGLKDLAVALCPLLPNNRRIFLNERKSR
jgi:hypothetical protein